MRPGALLGKVILAGALAFTQFLLITAAGCGDSRHAHEARPSVYTQMIRGEILEVSREPSVKNRKGDLGTVLIEGTRSSLIEEALLTVTDKTRVVDRRGSNEITVGFEAVSEKQTVEARFTVLSRAPEPWRAEVDELAICP